MAKPDGQLKRRDGERGHNRARDYREPMRDHVVLHLASGKRPSGPRQDNSKPQVVKQGVNGALRAANLRLLLEHAPVREALALVAEVPLERLEAMSQGALCPDETAFHIERTLKLPGKWLDGLNKAVPERTLELLKHPDKAALHDEDFDEDATASTAAAASVAPVLPAGIAPASGRTQAPLHDTSVERGPAAGVVAAASMERATVPAGSDEAVAVADALQAPATSAAQTPTAATAQSTSRSRDTHPMTSAELRKRSLSLLLQGKGAKSALARLIGISQPYMSTIANGGKVLDQEFCSKVAKALGLPENWFEAPRTAADIPDTVLKLLAPLSRGTAASASAAPDSVQGEAEADPAATGAGARPEVASAPAEPGESARAVAAAAGDATSTSAGRKDTAKPPRVRPVLQREDDRPRTEATAAVRSPATVPVQADLLAQVEHEVQPAAPATGPALHAEVTATPALVLTQSPVVAPVFEIAKALAQRTNDFTPMVSQPLVIEGGLAPITEALIKMLVLKARQGALSEDKAFELLGAVRLL
ncbi:helix-turn-helix domain-containing protein [Azohydromonas aeria]|uniref:helix-turn-helix domain-containing protein n=1 Tax=Azohydromonas aeria TaxID=2590212 RepID=UPI0012F830AD|nr:helix-turn-helix transcriptional regulator [Azohydromonas aeria]